MKEEAEAAAAKSAERKPTMSWDKMIGKKFNEMEIQNFLLEKNNDNSQVSNTEQNIEKIP
jgi:hypothetical protein